MRIMVLTDGKRLKVTEQEEIAISADLDNADSERVEVKGTMYKKSLIGYFDEPTQDEIESGRIIDIWSDARVVLAPGKKCQGTASIQREINDRSKAMSGRSSEYNPEALGWAKLITDRDWREMMREVIHSEDPEKTWCDHYLRTCVCHER